MNSRLIAIIESESDERNSPVEEQCRNLTSEELLAECEALDIFSRAEGRNLYHRVRALFFLYVIHGFHLPSKLTNRSFALVPYEGYTLLLSRRFRDAIDVFLASQSKHGASDALCSALSKAYRECAYELLKGQVRRCVRSVTGNRWLFRMTHVLDQSLRLHPALVQKKATDSYPVLIEKTPVRMDLSHSGWSDIFFLGMDLPQYARVLNISIDLALREAGSSPSPPIETSLRVIDKPIIRLISVDLKEEREIETVGEAFEMARDHLGLLKGALIASGLVPPALEGSSSGIKELLDQMGVPGGLEIITNVRDIPKGSRFAVSTSLLASMIALCMRATGQTENLNGELSNMERRIVAARAILGEWLAGSGGGWQDSGSLWPGIKLITGVPRKPDDPDQTSRGELLPACEIFEKNLVSDEVRKNLGASLVLVHGGMVGNVGHVLEMVTEKYLLRDKAEWDARGEAIGILDDIRDALKKGDIRKLAAATDRNFAKPIQTIIPAASNKYTETLIASMKARFNKDFWGFWMLGGMSGGGMGFWVSPDVKSAAEDFLQAEMNRVRGEMDGMLPFGMDPTIYRFAINDRGTIAELHQTAVEETRGDAVMQRGTSDDLDSVLKKLKFSRKHQDDIRRQVLEGKISLAQNRLHESTVIEDVTSSDLIELGPEPDREAVKIGETALREGRVGMISLAAGAATRWTQGARVVKALHPFVKLGGKYRNFLEIHIGKNRKTGRDYDSMPPHIVSTSYLTHELIERQVKGPLGQSYAGPLLLSPGANVGLRMIPTIRDLDFEWREISNQKQDEQRQKMLEGQRKALQEWVRKMGEGRDYAGNSAMQCIHPNGHWYEIPNLLSNGTLSELLKQRPGLRYLMLHNVDTLGANLDPQLIGLHIKHGWTLSFEVVRRRIEDRGGGLARVNGRVRLVEGLAMPRESDEFKLSFYNTMTTWIDIDRLLAVFGLTRDTLDNEAAVNAGIENVARNIKTYITLKDVRRSWGKGQEDTDRVAQVEKLWGDMTTLTELPVGFIGVPRQRGQQLKEQAQLDAWMRESTASEIEKLCDWS